MISGIYKIQSKIKPERFYIGSSGSMKKRWATHVNSLKRGKHHSKQLQRHFNKYSADDLTFTVLVRCEARLLLQMEQVFLDSHDPYFNVCKVAAGSCRGMTMSAESNRKRSETLKGRVFSEETKRKISEAVSGEKHRLWGKSPSAETIEKNRINMTGSNNHRFGKAMSDETKLKIGLANRGKKRSEAVRDKQRNQVVSEETRQKLSKAGKGKKRSEETRARMRRAQDKRWGRIAGPIQGQLWP